MTLEDLDANYAHLIGPYADSFYFERSIGEQFWQDVKSFVYHGRAQKIRDASPSVTTKCGKSFSSQEMLRDIFLWSVYWGDADIAFVLLLKIESRMSAALVASGIAQHLSIFASTLDVQHKYVEQAKKYEAYATDCINACYKHHERRACQLLLRENPLFGNVTCMQVSQT